MAIKENIIDTFEIGTDNRPVGAEADNVAIQRDTNGNIIATEKASGAIQESAAYTLKTVEENIDSLETQLDGVVNDLGGITFGIDPTTGKCGYYENGTFKSFRQPTEGVAKNNQATAAQVLSGQYFANESSDNIEGEMTDWSKNVPTTWLTGGDPIQTKNISPGYYTQLIINAESVYDAGQSAAQSVFIYDTIEVAVNGHADLNLTNMQGSAKMNLKNVSEIIYKGFEEEASSSLLTSSLVRVRFRDENNNFISDVTCTTINQNIAIPNNAIYAEFMARGNYSNSNDVNIDFNAKWQLKKEMKIIRGNPDN